MNRQIYTILYRSGGSNKHIIYEALKENVSAIIPTFLIDNIADGDEACSSVNDVDFRLRRSVDVYREFSRSRLLSVYVELVYNRHAYTLSCTFLLPCKSSIWRKSVQRVMTLLWEYPPSQLRQIV